MRAISVLPLTLALCAPQAWAASRLDGPFDDSVASYTLISNGDMESHSGSTLSSWTDGTGGLHGYDSRMAYAGSGSSGLLDQSWTSTGAGVAMRQSVAVTHRSWYVLSGYIYNGISGGGNAYLDLADQSYTQADGGSGDCSSVSSSGHGDWQFVHCEFYVPNGVHSVTVRTVTDGTIHAGSYAWFDEVALTPSGSFAPPESWSDDGDGDGYSEIDGDCDDTDASLSPGVPELCDGIDNDCDGAVDEGSAVDASTWYADSDGDGFGDPGSATAACARPAGHLADASDCDDGDAAAYPGATEFCDGHDDDCDGAVDEASAVDAATWYADADGDGFGDVATTTRACALPSGHSADSSDCDDGDAAVHPAADERCDGRDDDCDGVVDEDDAVDAATWYADSDGDGFGDAASARAACTQPSGFVELDTDCDDGDSGAHPGADERCDGHDDDCDGAVDEDDAVDAGIWHPDWDGDGYGDLSTSSSACTQPTGSVADGSDCDDHNAAVFPGSDEYCNGYDDDCDGIVDESDALDARSWYVDRDGDGYGHPTDTVSGCSQPAHSSTDNSDCDDSMASVHPGATEVWYDGIDQDCDGNDDDRDEDGYSIESDCDEDNPYVNPGAVEVWYDGVDQDCSGGSDYDRDGDGFDSASHHGEDCDDADDAVYPGAPDEPYDGVISDCDASDEYDADGDGYDSDAYGGTDCDDASSAVFPGADEVWYDGIDQDCDGNDDDQDGDGWPLDQDCDDTDAGVHEDCDPTADTGDTDLIPDDSGDSAVPGDSATPLPGDVYMGGGGFRCGPAGLAGLWLGLVGLLLGVRRRR